MKRVDLLKAAPLATVALIAGCTPGGILAPQPVMRDGRTIKGLVPVKHIGPHPPGAPPCDKWQFPWVEPSKDGSGGYCEVHYRTDCSASWQVVGGIYLNLLIGKGGQMIKDDVVFTSTGGRSQTFHLSQLPAIFHEGGLIQIFKDWLAQMDPNDSNGVSVFSPSGKLVGYGSSTKHAASSSITLYPPSSGTQWTTDWGGAFGGSRLALPGRLSLGPNFDGAACVVAVAAWLIVGICVIGTAIGGIAGPVEWLFFAAAVAGWIAVSSFVLEDCL